MPQPSAAVALRALLRRPEIHAVPGCFDALSARLIERAGFPLAYMDGFAVTLARLGLPDAGLISYGEIVDQGRDVCAAVTIPVIGDGGCGHGGAMNVKRTVDGYAAAGFAAIVIGDRSTARVDGGGPAKGVIDRDDALVRVAAACDARDEGSGIVVVARTDAGAGGDLDEALWRAQAFADQGADIIFLGTPCAGKDLERFCAQVAVPKMLVLGAHDEATLDRLQAVGIRLAVDPLTPMTAAAGAMEGALVALRERRPVIGAIEASRLSDIAGLPRHIEIETGYGVDDGRRVRRPVAIPAPRDRSFRPRAGGENGAPKSSPGHWIVGAMFVLIGVFSLHMASQAEDRVTYLGGIAFFVATVLFIFWLIHKVTGEKT
ncbi:MAG: oxaloacetate decarboxylase [Rhodospirillales bacterium]